MKIVMQPKVLARIWIFWFAEVAHFALFRNKHSYVVADRVLGPGVGSRVNSHG